METLKIDIDGCKWLGGEIVLAFLMAKRAWFLKRVRHIRIRFLGVSETARGWHVRISLDCKPEEVPFYQLVFFSDFRREVFNINRNAKWNILFEKKYSVVNGKLFLLGEEKDTWRCRLFRKAWQFWGEWHG
jgi:hypothetical protein